MKKKIILIMKRFGSGRDMIKENFGREIRLSEPLTQKYDITIVGVDFHKKGNFTFEKNHIKYVVYPFNILNPFAFTRKLSHFMQQGKYDLVIPTTEPLIGIAGFHAAQKHNIKVLYEVQDNYEAYYSYKLPFVKQLDERVIKKSHSVFFSNYALMQKLRHLRGHDENIVENGVDLSLFEKIPKKQARQKVGFDQSIKIVTYTGGIHKLKGVQQLIDAVRELYKQDKNVRLLLSGPIHKGFSLHEKFIMYRAFKKRQDLVYGMNASDVLVIPNPENKFTKYCIPLKLFEYMALDIPIVATKVGDVKRILEPFPESLCEPNDIDDLREKIKSQLTNTKTTSYSTHVKQYTWNNLSKKFEHIIEKALQ